MGCALGTHKVVAVWDVPLALTRHTVCPPEELLRIVICPVICPSTALCSGALHTPSCRRQPLRFPLVLWHS